MQEFVERWNEMSKCTPGVCVCECVYLSRQVKESRILTTSAAHRWPYSLLYHSGQRPLESQKNNYVSDEALYTALYLIKIFEINIEFKNYIIN